MGDGTDPSGPYIDEVNRVGRLLMAAWEAAEGTQVNASYVATFADMARAVVEAAKHDAWDEGFTEGQKYGEYMEQVSGEGHFEDYIPWNPYN